MSVLRVMSQRNRIPHPSQEDAGKEFPFRFACSIFVGGVSVLLAFIPWLALTLPTAPRTDLPWHHNPMIYRYEGHNISFVIADLERAKEQQFGAILIGPVYIPETEALDWSQEFLAADRASYGTASDIKQLLKQAHQKGLKVIFDFEPNHTFFKHPWFKKSEGSSVSSPYHSLYIWQNSKYANKKGEPQEPNTWHNVAGKSAWTFSRTRNQYYYHQYGEDQPDLNFRNNKVLQIIQEFMLFWAKEGVDGFYIRSVPRLYENQDLTATDYTCSCKQDTAAPDGSQLTSHQDETLSLVSSWRNIFKKNIDNHVFMAAEVCDCDGSHYREYYKHGVDMVVHPTLWQGSGTTDARCLWEKMIAWYSNVPIRKWPGWVEFPVNRDCSHSIITLFSASLPGALIVKHKETPFSKHKIAVDTSISDLRSSLAFLVGDTILLMQEQDSLIFMREAEAKMSSKYIIALNFNENSYANINLTDTRTVQPGIKIPQRCKVVAISEQCGTKKITNKQNIGKLINLQQENLVLSPNQGIILQTV